MEEREKQIMEVITKLENKDFSLYFFTLDTKGNPSAGIATIYEHVKVLNSLGYKAYILHEKNDYKIVGDENGSGVADWLGAEYAMLPHFSLEGQQLNVGPQDFIIIPEIFANIMGQLKAFPCKKIVMSQSYDYLLELLPIGQRWTTDFGFHDVITTSNKQAAYLKSLFPTINTHVVPVSIPSYFKPNEKPKMPIVAIHTRTQGEAAKIAKSFYLQYPMYKWVTFKELRGMSRANFAKELANSCVVVWIDDTAGFGTLPLEAFECGTPVIGKMPNMIPEWMETINEAGEGSIKDNGVWTNTTLNIPELIATYMKVWLEDSVPQDLLNSMKESAGVYTEERQKVSIETVYGQIIEARANEMKATLAAIESQITKA